MGDEVNYRLQAGSPPVGESIETLSGFLADTPADRVRLGDTIGDLGDRPITIRSVVSGQKHLTIEVLKVRIKLWPPKFDPQYLSPHAAVPDGIDFQIPHAVAAAQNY